MAQASDNRVSLGYGTLILIAVIVMIFSRGNDSRELERRMDRLKDEVRNVNSKAGSIASDIHDLENQVNQLQKSIDGLRQDLKKLRVPEAPVPPVER